MLSGGQRQRISLARAILKDDPIVVLDEATAYADPENEEKMEAAIAELVKGKTLVVIAHKLPAIINADQICVMDHGKLVATGKHQELIQSCPEYAFMVTVEKFMRHGCENVPAYMLSGSRGDFTGVGDIHFFYSADEVLYGALPDFEEACKRANVPYTVSARPKMVHCYCMLPIFKEAKEDFAKIVDILKK